MVNKGNDVICVVSVYLRGGAGRGRGVQREQHVSGRGGLADGGRELAPPEPHRARAAAGHAHSRQRVAVRVVHLRRLTNKKTLVN